MIKESKDGVYKEILTDVYHCYPNQMERLSAEEVMKTYGNPVPMQYEGEINLQAALLLLFVWDA